MLDDTKSSDTSRKTILKLTGKLESHFSRENFRAKISRQNFPPKFPAKIFAPFLTVDVKLI
jgi:hypothetical protein